MEFCPVTVAIRQNFVKLELGLKYCQVIFQRETHWATFIFRQNFVGLFQKELEMNYSVIVGDCKFKSLQQREVVLRTVVMFIASGPE